MRAHRVRTVAAFEFLAVVRSKSWLITTFGMPVFLAIYGGIASIPRWLESRRAETAVYGVVDAASVLALSADVSQSAVQVPDAVRDVLSRTGRGGEVGRTLARFNDVVFRPFGDEAAARAEVLSRTIKGYFVLPADYRETGHVTLVAGERALGSSEARAALSKLLLERLLAGNVPDDLASRIREPIAKTERFTLTSAGELVQGGVVALVLRFALPLVMMMLLMISILMSAGALVQATAIEKENKVVEVLLSSAPSEEILLGKLLGLGGAGALQIAVWFSMIGVGSLVFAATLATMGIEMPWLGLVTAALVFPLAYLLYGSLMLGMIWSLFLVVPLIFLESLLREPHGTAGHVLTWIPPFTPLALVLRATIDPTGMPMWEIAGALALLVVATWLAIRLSARLFRVGILLTGARPKLRQIWRQSRL
jgi:ABC-2 type transport system permease protein